MHKKARFVHILIKNYAKQRLIVVFSICFLCFISVSLNCVKDMPRARIFRYQDPVYFKEFVQLFKNTSSNCKGEVCEREQTTVFLGAI